MDTIQLLPKKEISGVVHVPSSKSYAQRAIAIASLSQKIVVIDQVGENDDVVAAQNCIRSMGAQFTEKKNALFFQKSIDLKYTNSIEVNCGESGLSARLFSAFSLLYNQQFKILGEGSVTNRTMEMVIEGLKQFGKKVESENTYLPLTISESVSAQEIEIDGSITSQFLTGLLIVAPFLPFDTKIKVNNLISRPYIEMTLDLVSHFGVDEIENKQFESFYIKGNQKISHPTTYTVEGDWSAAANFIVAGAIGGKIELKGLARNSKQGDRAILDAVKNTGANVYWEGEHLFIERNTLKSFEFDATECPDLFPALVVLAAYTRGNSTIKGVNRLKHKESNRADTLRRECSKIGVTLAINDDIMVVHGKGEPTVDGDVTFFSHGDHRIAMAMSLFSIGAESPIQIKNHQSINKSYPHFYKDLARL